MARGGRRYHLLLYSYTLNHWWRPALWIGIILLALGAALYEFPALWPQYFTRPAESVLFGLAGVGALSILGAVFVLLVRKSAYVRPFPSYLRVVTPLLGMNISYKRIRQATSVEMQGLFPLERQKGWKRKFLHPLAGLTAVVLEMNGWPMRPDVLRLFLSPFFFPDKSPRLALLVPNWMEFSTELESFRSTWQDAQRAKPPRTAQSDLLASLSRPKR